MSARYLLRFDDICPTTNWRVWSSVESALISQNVKPILAVVPDNRDPNLEVCAPRADFWDQVRKWQAQGWTIGLHGHQHVYSSPSSGIMGIHAGSEFAGHAVDVQRRKLEAASSIFRREGVLPSLFIAPGHAFDETTVELLHEFGITVISDGFYCRPIERNRTVWLPQQLWRFRHMPFGLWTVCLHINSWDEAATSRFVQVLEQFAKNIVSFDAVMASPLRTLGSLDRAFDSAFRTLLRARLRRGRTSRC